MRNLPRGARIYIVTVWVASAAVTVPVFWQSFSLPTLIALVAAAIAAEYSAVPLRRITVSVGFSIGLAAILLLPPSAAALVSMTAAFSNVRRRPGVRRYFNGSMLACTNFVAALGYGAVGGEPGHTPTSLADLARALVAALIYCVLNGLLLAGVLRTAEGVPILSVWRSTLGSSVAGYLSYGLFGVIIAALWNGNGGPAAALLVLLPLYVARWAFAQYEQQRLAHEAAVSSLVQAVETKDHYTRGHSERVSRASVMIANQLGLTDERTEALRLAGMLHDLGKLGVPTRLLQKAGSLTETEYAAIQLHPVRGVEVVRGIEFLSEAYKGILHHHERFDGRGYPHGLAGLRIPEFARVIAVADAFDCMTSTRAYRGARSVDEALVELRRCAGAQFDPEMVRAIENAVATTGWQPAITPPPAEAALSSAEFDHDDPTLQVPVMGSDQQDQSEPAIGPGPRHARDLEQEQR